MWMLSRVKYHKINKNTHFKHRARYEEHIKKETKSIPFLEDWWREREIQESLCVNTMSFKEVQTKKTMNSHKRLRENWKWFWKLSLKRETRVFCDWGESLASRQGKPPKQSKSKLWKNFLSVFRDLKVYSRGSRELSRENLCVPLVTGPFTREQVAKIDTRARGSSMRLGWLATESPK